MDIYDESGSIVASTPDQPLREIAHAYKPRETSRSDIISRLRGMKEYWQHWPLYSEAADEIERLRAWIKEDLVADMIRESLYDCTPTPTLQAAEQRADDIIRSI